jgi:hypothetical protein
MYTVFPMRWMLLVVFWSSALGALLLGYPRVVPMPDLPRSPIDKRIDELGAESRILSEADAETYIGALLEKFDLDETRLPGLGTLKSSLAKAEYAAIRDPSKRIPEAMVVHVFNELMAEWNSPDWTRISSDELHVFRIVVSMALYPRSVSRSPDGSLSHDCRPVEALYLIYLLQSRGGVSLDLRVKVQSGEWPKAVPRQLESLGPSVVRLKSEGSPAEAQRLREYLTARARYFADHPGSGLRTEVDNLFGKLLI